MNSWLLVFIALVNFLILLARINIYVELHFCRCNNDDYITITVSALQQLLYYNIKVPSIMLIDHDNLPWVASEIKTPHGTTKTKVNREQRFFKKTIKMMFFNPERFLHLFRLTKQIYRTYSNYMNTLARGIHCEKFELKTTYGLGDAALTGIFMGMIGAVTQVALLSMHRRITFDARPSIKIQPIFEQSQLALELNCIFRIRFGNVIIATIEVLRNLLREEATRSG